MPNDKKMLGNSLINIDDKKLLIGLFAIFVIGTLFSGNLTGNAGRVRFATQLDSNEFNMLKGSAQLYKGNVIRLDNIGTNGEIVVSLINDYGTSSRTINAGDRLYFNGYYITNVASDYKGGSAIVRIE